MIEGGEPDRAQAEKGQAIDRLGTADEIAQAVLWLCSPGASHVTGIARPVDGGYTTQRQHAADPDHTAGRGLDCAAQGGLLDAVHAGHASSVATAPVTPFCRTSQRRDAWRRSSPPTRAGTPPATGRPV
ncbi:SDR family oxidoreductase [Actinomadura sp. NPDC047616]|uniref:SDR family oxidoreductase n=1 Tax=Actinomadura sp. NPDC047616 TaxID=3155914 RepID=UPI0033C66718